MAAESNPTPDLPPASDAQISAAFDLFLEVVDAAPDERRAILEARCGEDAALMAMVLRLVARDAGDRTGAVPDRESSADEAVERTGLVNSLRTGEGGRVTMAKTEAATQPILSVLAGRYRILRLLGEGGMGAVYEAEQLSPRRSVALKAFRSTAIGGESALRRFALEAEVLARLQHPSIAQVFEAGFGDENRVGPAWIAMELVRGDRLDAAANARGLDHRARLQLFLDICDAIAFAHQRGVIHRDLKPANILLTEPSSDAPFGRIKVLDFGVARVIGAEWDEETALTGPGQLLGTLPYMSPEQVAGHGAGRGDAIDVRTDVYALGVILFELLVGRRPFDLKGRAVDDAVRIVRYDDPPLASSLASTDEAVRLRGDLDAIMMKALAKEPADRYRSVAAFADDVRAHLASEPVSARAGSALYVVLRHANRYRLPIAISVLVIAAIAAFAVRASIDAERSAELADEASRAERAAERASEALGRQLSITRIEQARLMAASGNLPGAIEILGSEGKPEFDPRLRWAMREIAARHPCNTAWKPHTTQVRAAALVDGGRLIVSAAEDGRVALSDADGGLIHCVEASGPVLGGAFDATTATFTVGCLDGSVLRYDARTLSEVESVIRHPAAVRGVAAIDGMVAAGDIAGHLVLRRADGAMVTLPSRAAPVVAMAFLSPDELIVGDDSGAVTLIRISDLSSRVIARHEGTVVSLGLDPARRRVISGGIDRMLIMSLVDEPTVTNRIADAGNGTIRAIGIERDSGDLFVSGWWSIDRWDETLRARRRMASPPDGPNVAEFAVDRGVVLTGHSDGTLRLWSLTNTPVNGGGVAIEGVAGRVTSVLAPDGKLLVSGDGFGGVTVADAATGRTLSRMASHERRVRAVALSPDSSVVASAGDDRILQLADCRSGTILSRYGGIDPQNSASIAFSPDGRSIAVTCLDRSVRVLTVPALQEVTRFTGSDRQMLGIAWSPDGRFIATTARDQQVRLWSSAGAPLASIVLPETPWTLAFSSDGTRLAVGEWSRSIAILDLPSLRLIRRVTGAGGLITGVVWLGQADSTCAPILGSCADGTVRVWDSRDGRPLFEFLPFAHTDTVSCSADSSGNLIAVSGTSGEAGVWSLATWDRWAKSGAGFR
jgi:WD40 repeat protein/tRNA A-37 threonylcarbamoyl transferase component Bud32